MSPQTKFFLQFIAVIFSSIISINAQTASPTPPHEDEPERIFTEEIKMNVSALDQNGKFVSAIQKEDLVIMEDGRIHQANSVRRIPANVLIVMDTGGEMRLAKSFNQTRATAKNLINALQPQDSVAIMQYHDKVEIIAEWTNKEEALKILNTKANFGKRSMFINALETATRFLQKTPLENRHLILITDGTDSFNKLSDRDAAMKNLLATDINVHVISYTQMEKTRLAPKKNVFMKGEPKPKRLPEEVVMTMPRGVQDLMSAPRLGSINTDREFLRKMKEREKSLDESEKYLTELSKDTNGEFILPESNEEMLDKTALVAQVIDSSYVVTYAPKRALKESPTGEVRNIEVSSRRANLQVQARRKLVVK
ncbi:MAG: VWA domain-containing protein [Acidobacteria bacterium]|nr:VWA domain-containing protein [Acidobacteriota bacterium]